MTTRNLVGRRVLVVEDECLFAIDGELALTEEGAQVVGPVASVRAALDVVERAERLDFAVLDINLFGERVDPVAEALQRRGVPFLFTTGYDTSGVSQKFAGVRLLEKPVEPEKVARTLIAMSLSPLRVRMLGALRIDPRAGILTM